MDVEKSSKVITFITGAISLVSLIAGLLLGDEGKRGQVIAISISAILLACLVYVTAGNRRKGYYGATGELRKTPFPYWGFALLVGIFVLWPAGIATIVLIPSVTPTTSAFAISTPQLPSMAAPQPSITVLPPSAVHAAVPTIASEPSPTPNIAAIPGKATLSVRAYIDGMSQLVIQGNTAYWHHVRHVVPGREGRYDYPTYLNGRPWAPVWPDVPNIDNVDCNCTSSAYKGIPPLATKAQSVHLAIVQARISARIVQKPDAANDYTLVVEFDDADEYFAEWYEIVLTYDVAS